MKIFLTIGAVSAFELAAVTPPPGCPDLDKYEICTAKCSADNEACKVNCSPDDFTCTSRCDAAALDCNNACPCSNGCPSGCLGCANPICSSEGEHLFILNAYSAARDQAFLIELATDTHKLSSFTYNDLFFDIEDSCYAFMKGEHWFLGGYYNERLIAKVNLGGCKIEPEQKVLAVTHVDGFYGSCAVYNDLTHMCFDSNGVGIDRCQTFDGEEGGQAVLPNRSNAPHDYAAMAIYDNKMWVVGGCDTYNDCHNIVESYDGSAWTAAPNIPVERDEIYSQLVLGDVNGLYSISGRYNGRNVFKFNGSSWTLLGLMSEAQADAYFFTSGKIVTNGLAYAGEDYMEKIQLSDTNFSSVNIGVAANGVEFDLYYAAMILVDGAICM